MGYATGIVVLLTVAGRRHPAARRCSAWPGCGSTAARPGAPATSRRPRRHSPTAARLAHTVARPPGRLAGRLGRRPARAGAPALGMKIGTSDAGNEAEDTTIRQAYDLVADGFGPGSNGAAARRRRPRPRWRPGRARRPAAASSPTTDGVARRAPSRLSPRTARPRSSPSTPTHRPAGRRDHRAARPAARRAADGRRHRRLHRRRWTDFTDRSWPTNLWVVVAVVIADVVRPAWCWRSARSSCRSRRRWSTCSRWARRTA